MTKRKIQYWVIPPEADAEFVANMEEVLETYAQPYDSACPLICMDEQPVQLVKEIRKIIPATKTHARRVDYEYERAGTASIFMFAEPLAGWRQATAREHRTKCRLDLLGGQRVSVNLVEIPRDPLELPHAKAPLVLQIILFKYCGRCNHVFAKEPPKLPA
jgi:hypothetical protein